MKEKPAQKSKQDIYWAVLDCVIRLDVQRGHMAWKITDISRYSQISRPLIYYYFGKSKESIMKTAIEFLGEEYFGLSEERLNLWKSGKVVESVLRSRVLCQKAPYVHLFYMFRRNMESVVGETLRQYEDRYRKKIQEYCPNLSKDSAEALSAVLFGLVAMPEISDKGVMNAVEMIEKNIAFKK